MGHDYFHSLFNGERNSALAVSLSKQLTEKKKTEHEISRMVMMSNAN